MNGRVLVDWERGEALVGGVVVAIAPVGVGGAMQVGGAMGAVLRPLKFLERTQVTVEASLAAEPRRALCARVLQRAIVKEGEGDRSVQEILALFLAGADQDAHGFAETESVVMRSLGWSWTQVAEMPALEVDQLALRFTVSQQTDDWTSFVFVNHERQDLETIRTEFADNLLKRTRSASLTEHEIFSADVEESLIESNIQQNLSNLQHWKNHDLRSPSASFSPSSSKAPQPQATTANGEAIAHQAFIPSRVASINSTNPETTQSTLAQEATANWEASPPEAFLLAHPVDDRPAPSSQNSTSDPSTSIPKPANQSWKLTTSPVSSPPPLSSRSLPSIQLLRPPILTTPSSQPFDAISQPTSPAIHSVRSTDWQKINMSFSTSSVTESEELNSLFTHPSLQPKLESSQSINSLINSSDPVALADALAELLHHEADLRGIDR